MTLPHLAPLPGPAADFAARLRGALPRLETERLVLRPPVLEDAPFWNAILAADTEGHMGGPFGAEDAFADFAATTGLWLLRGHGLWTVTGRDESEGGPEDGTVLGFVLIGFEPGDLEPELGWLFLPEFKGKGYATEAARAARRHAFGALNLPGLVSYIAPGNAASRRVAERLGARRDGSLDGTEVWRHAPETGTGRAA